MALDPETVKAFVAAIMETDVMQFCRGLMEQRAKAPPVNTNANRAPAKPAAPAAPPAKEQYKREPCGRQLADESLDVVRNSRDAGKQIGFDEANRIVKEFYARGTRHPLHRPRGSELYSLENSTSVIRQRVDALQTAEAASDRAREFARSVIERAGQKRVSYETARMELLGR